MVAGVVIMKKLFFLFMACALFAGMAGCDLFDELDGGDGEFDLTPTKDMVAISVNGGNGADAGGKDNFEIADPYGKSRQTYEACARKVDQCVALAVHLRVELAYDVLGRWLQRHGRSGEKQTAEQYECSIRPPDELTQHNGHD